MRLLKRRTIEKHNARKTISYRLWHKVNGKKEKDKSPLRDSELFETNLCLANNFDATHHQLNYYKFIRRMAMYMLQVVEGFKRSTPETTYGDISLVLKPNQFDETLRCAYQRFVESQDDLHHPYDALFAEDTVINDVTKHRQNLYRSIESLVKFVDI